jgi:hypothetical protein
MQKLEFAGIEIYRQNEKLAMWVNHILIVAMMVCLAITVRRLAQGIAPQWRGDYLPILVALISIETMYTWRMVRRQADVHLPVMVYRLVEWIVWLVLVKLFLYIWNGFDHLWTDLSNIWTDFFFTVLQEEYLFVILLLAVIWILSASFAKDLAEIEGDETLLELVDYEGFTSNRSATRKSLMNRIFVVGMTMVFMTILIRLDLASLTIGPPLYQSSFIYIVIYFILALILLAQTQFAVLRAGWAWDRIQIGQGMTRKWTLYSAVFLLSIALITYFLPTNYTVGLLDIVGRLLSGLFLILSFLVYLIIFPVFLLISYLNRLLSGSDSDPFMAAPEMPDIAVVRETVASSGELFDIIKSIVFWIVFLGIIGFALYHYLHQNEELLAKIKQIPGLSWLVRSLRWIWGRWLGVKNQISSVVKAGVARLHSVGNSDYRDKRQSFYSLNRLTPREKVIFFYLAMVRRGKESDLPRKPHQTPDEYARYLEKELPDASLDLDKITGEFLVARYSDHEISPATAGLVRQYWERLRKVFQNRSQNSTNRVK